MGSIYRVVVNRTAVCGPAVQRDREDDFDSLEALEKRLATYAKEGRKPKIKSVTRITTVVLGADSLPERFNKYL